MTPHPWMLVDFTPLFLKYDPSSPDVDFYPYDEQPGVSLVVRSITLQMLIECSFLLTYDALPYDNPIYSYITFNKPFAETLLNNDERVRDGFGLLLDELLEFGDTLIRLSSEKVQPSSVDYGNYVFDSWYSETTALLVWEGR